MSAIFVRAKIATEFKTLSTREQRPDSAISQLAIVLLRVLWKIQAEMSRDSHGNPCQPHCVFVWKNLGIASACAAGLKELTQSLNG